jgi:3-phytase/alkaline phosphatase D
VRFSSHAPVKTKVSLYLAGAAGPIHEKHLDPGIEMTATRTTRPNIFPSAIAAVILLLFFLLPLPSTSASNFPPTTDPEPTPATVVDIKPLGVVTIPSGTIFKDTEVGGLSGITYDAARGIYYAISDDGSRRAPARYYTLGIDLSDERLADGDVTLLDVTFLRDENDQTYAPRTIDPESIELVYSDQLFISSEGNVSRRPYLGPTVNRLHRTGMLDIILPIPEKFSPDLLAFSGIRPNRAFESLTSTPDRQSLYVATENALRQDGSKPAPSKASPSRLVEYSLDSLLPGAEYVYEVSCLPKAPIPILSTIFGDNGLVELQALDNSGTFLALERSFALGAGHTIRLFETSIESATDVSQIEDLDAVPSPEIIPVSKQLLVDFEEDLDFDPDNIEGMTFGPSLSDGYQSLILVSDNNFSPLNSTQFILLGVKIEPAEQQTG